MSRFLTGTSIKQGTYLSDRSRRDFFSASDVFTLNCGAMQMLYRYACRSYTVGMKQDNHAGRAATDTSAAAHSRAHHVKVGPAHGSNKTLQQSLQGSAKENDCDAMQWNCDGFQTNLETHSASSSSTGMFTNIFALP